MQNISSFHLLQYSEQRWILMWVKILLTKTYCQHFVHLTQTFWSFYQNLYNPQVVSVDPEQLTDQGMTEYQQYDPEQRQY